MAALKAKLEEEIKAEKARAQSQNQFNSKQYDDAKEAVAAMAEAKLKAQAEAFRIKEEQFKQEQERVQQHLQAERAHNMKIIAEAQAEHAKLQERIITEAQAEHAKLQERMFAENQANQEQIDKLGASFVKSTT